VNNSEKSLDRKCILNYSGLLKQEHKILNLDDAKVGAFTK